MHAPTPNRVLFNRLRIHLVPVLIRPADMIELLKLAIKLDQFESLRGRSRQAHFVHLYQRRIEVRRNLRQVKEL
jgi:hypothetical protein